MICECSFQFSKAGEFRKCTAFITNNGHSGVVCPKCGNQYIGNVLVRKAENGNNRKGKE